LISLVVSNSSREWLEIPETRFILFTDGAKIAHDVVESSVFFVVCNPSQQVS
jgi:hypothetical protein